MKSAEAAKYIRGRRKIVEALRGAVVEVDALASPNHAPYMKQGVTLNQGHSVDRPPPLLESPFKAEPQKLWPYCKPEALYSKLPTEAADFMLLRAEPILDIITRIVEGILLALAELPKSSR